MDTFKDKLRGVIVWIIIILMIFGPELAYALEDAALPAWLTNDYARIVDMDYKAVVVDEPGSEGKIVVTERITFDVHAASRSNGFWELWRDLCEDWIDGCHVHYKVNSVKQIMPDGREVVWPESPQLYWDDYDYVSSNKRLGPGKWYHSEGPYSEYMEQYECVFFYVDNLYREKVTFEIEYEMYNAVLRYGDCSDLYIAMYSGNTTKYLESFNAEILIPDKDMPSAGNYMVTTYGTNNNNFPVQESKTKNPGYHTFYFNLTEDQLKFNPYNEYIEFDLVSYGEDKHAFADYASRDNDYYNDVALDEIKEEQAAYATAPSKFRAIKFIVLLICLVVTALSAFNGKEKIAKLKRKYPFYNSEQTLGTYRDIPSDLDPNFAAELVFCKDKKREDDSGVYSALLLSLARKKYIELQDLDSSDVMIVLNDTPPIDVPLPPEAAKIKEIYDKSGYAKISDPPMYISVDDEDPLKKFYSSKPTPGANAYGSFEPHGLSYGQDAIREPVIQQNIENTETVDAPELLLIPGDAPADIDPLTTLDEPDIMLEEPVTVEPVEIKEPLTMSEQHYLDLIKRHAHNGMISMSNLQNRVSTDYAGSSAFEANIKHAIVNCGVGLGYLQKADWKEPKRSLAHSGNTFLGWGIAVTLANIITYHTRLDFVFGGLFLLGAICIAIGLYLKSQAHKYVLLTSYGEGEYQKWRGLYNFLKSDTLIHERTVVELPLWEKYLVYATAFGISEKVIAAIKIRCPQILENQTQSKSIVHSSYCRSGRIHTSGRRFRSSVRSGSSFHSFSSGGGYGGGGRGGGGGGGGH